MKKRVISCVLLASVCLCACGTESSSATESSTAEAEETVAAETTASAEETTAAVSTEEAAASETTESEAPTEAEISEAFNALADAIPDSELEQYEEEAENQEQGQELDQDVSRSYLDTSVGYYPIDVDGDGIPELVRRSADGITVVFYDKESGECDSVSDQGGLTADFLWIPDTGDFILKHWDWEETENGEMQDIVMLQKYHLENGTVTKLEEGTIQEDFENTQGLQADGEEVDVDAFLSLFDVDHARTPEGEGWNPALMKRYLQSEGALEQEDEAVVYLSYLNNRVKRWDPNNTYLMCDLNGDDCRELIEVNYDYLSENVYTVVGDEMVLIGSYPCRNGGITPDETSHVLYAEDLSSESGSRAENVSILQDGMLLEAELYEEWPIDQTGEEVGVRINGVMAEENSDRDLYGLADSSSGSDILDETKSPDEMMSALKKEIGNSEASSYDSWWMESYAMTLEGILEGEVGLGNGQSAFEQPDMLSYQLLDLDGNDRPELLVGFEHEYDIFLPRKGSVGQSATSISTNAAWDSETHEIYFDDFASEYVSTDIGYRIDGDEAVYVESVSYIWYSEESGTRGLYQTPDGAEVFDPDDPPEEVTALENMEDDVPADAWKDLSYRNIIDDFGSIPGEVSIPEDEEEEDSLWDAVGDPEETLNELLSGNLTSWQQSYSMALTALSSGQYAAEYIDGDDGLGYGYCSDYCFQLLDLNFDSVPELLIAPYDQTGDTASFMWVVFHPVDGCAAEPCSVVLEGFNSDTGLCLYNGNVIAGSSVFGYGIGTFDGSAFQNKAYLTFGDGEDNQYVNFETGENRAVDEEGYDVIRSQWQSDFAALPTNALGEGEIYYSLNADNIMAALGAEVEPVFSEDTRYHNISDMN